MYWTLFTRKSNSRKSMNIKHHRFPWCPRHKIKQTHTDVYLNWNSHAPTTWKISTIRTFSSEHKRAFSISSTETALNHELSRLRKVKEEEKEDRYKGNWRKQSPKHIHSNNKMQIIYNTKKLSSNLPVKRQKQFPSTTQYSLPRWMSRTELLLQLHWSIQMQTVEMCYPAQ